VKRIIAVVLTVLMVSAIIFGGCAKPDEGTPTTPTEPTTPKVKPIEWRFASFIPPFDCFSIDVINWADQLEEATGGRFKINFYWSESLIKIAGILDGVGSGTCDMAHPSISGFPERLPLALGLGLPGIFENNVQCGQTVMALYNKYPEMREEYGPTTVVWYQMVGPCNLMSKRPVQTLEDFKGLKIAATSKFEVLSWKALGATVVSVMVTEAYHALETGVVDAASGDWNRHYLWKFYEITKYRTDNTIGTISGYPTLRNNASWDKLPEDIKKAWNELTDPVEYNKRNNEGWFRFNADSIEKMLEHDKKVGNPPWYVLPDDERQRWLDVLQPINEEWVAEMEAKGLPGEAYYADLLAFAEQYKWQP